MKKLAAIILGLSLSATAFAVQCPDGSFVGGSTCTLCPDGTYVSGRCVLQPNGTYTGG